MVTIRVPCESQADIQFCLNFLADVAERQYRAHPELVRDAVADGVRYERETEGMEEWLTPLEVRERGVADCEDLSADRAGFLRARRGINARPYVRRSHGGSGYHCVDVVGSTFEDPSREAGMQ